MIPIRCLSCGKPVSAYFDEYNKRVAAGEKSKGKTAFKGLKAFVGVPAEYADAELTAVPEAEYKDLKKGVELGEISKLLGATF